MSIFSKRLKDLSFEDIEQLVTDSAQENIRLEFKRAFPSKDEMLKKVSSFANTFGGYIVIGASEDGKGNLKAIDGIPPVSGHKQKTVQWCFQHVHPPITPEVSNPIPHATDPQKFLYVIYVEQSHRAPHFLNGRRGCYVRTDEYSHGYKPRLATYEDIRFLLDRRQASVELREQLIERAQKRFGEHALKNYRALRRIDRGIDATMSLSVVPLFPGPFVSEVDVLRGAMNASRMKAAQSILPSQDLRSQHEGFYLREPGSGSFSYLEADVHGLMYFAQEIARLKGEIEDPAPQDFIISARRTGAWMFFYLRYAGVLYSKIGYEGTLILQLRFDNIKGRTFLLENPNLLLEDGPKFSSEFDDKVEIVEKISTRDLHSSGILDLMHDLFSRVCFAFGCSSALSEPRDVMERYIDYALRYLSWSRADVQSQGVPEK